MRPKLSNPLLLLCITFVMFAATGCSDSAKQEETKTDSVPAATPPPAPETKPDSSTMKKDSLPPVDSSTTPRPDTKKT